MNDLFRIRMLLDNWPAYYNRAALTVIERTAVPDRILEAGAAVVLCSIGVILITLVDIIMRNRR